MKQKFITLSELTGYLNSYLDPFKIEEGAVNGIQVASSSPIAKIATAVTASLETIEKAITESAQVLVVHHGIFVKNDPYPITGIKYKKIKLLTENNIALLCYHLPLDAHREVGNNWKAAQDIGLQNLQPFAEYNKIPVGVIGSIEPAPFAEFKKKVEDYYGRSAIAIQVKDSIRSVAVISGGAERFTALAAQAGADCFITGRVDEPVWDAAHEENISFLSLGHYTTETVGPKALTAHLQKIFGIPSVFIKTDNPF